MVTICAHSSDSFNNNLFGEDKEPTSDQINKYKLWKCPTCNKWYSLIDVIESD